MQEKTVSSALIPTEGCSKPKAGEYSNKAMNICLYSFVCVMTAVILATFLFVVLYVLRIQGPQQEVNESLLSKIEELEARLSAGGCQVPTKLNKTKTTPGAVSNATLISKPDARIKRQFLNTNSAPVMSNNPQEVDLVESEHIRNQHHGIASSHIALLFADPAEMKRISDEQTSNESLIKFKNCDKKDPLCSSLMENGCGGLWCKPIFKETQIDKYLLRGNSQHFPYLAKAPWMASQTSAENFAVTEGVTQSLVVKTSGIYIVTSSMHFTKVKFKEVHYAVYKRNRLNETTSERILGICVASINNTKLKQSGAIYPCSTWQLTPLEAGDRVFLKIAPFLWFRVQKETFFLAVIKLNSWTLDEQRNRISPP